MKATPGAKLREHVSGDRNAVLERFVRTRLLDIAVGGHQRVEDYITGTFG